MVDGSEKKINSVSTTKFGLYKNPKYRIKNISTEELNCKYHDLGMELFVDKV